MWLDVSVRSDSRIEEQEVQSAASTPLLTQSRIYTLYYLMESILISGLQTYDQNEYTLS